VVVGGGAMVSRWGGDGCRAWRTRWGQDDVGAQGRSGHTVVGGEAPTYGAWMGGGCGGGSVAGVGAVVRVAVLLRAACRSGVGVGCGGGHATWIKYSFFRRLDLADGR
jgi:hypothetical protein